MTGPEYLIEGERAALGPLRRDLAATYARWVNHADVRFGLEHLGVSTQETEEKWVDNAVEKGAKEEPEEAEFTIYARSDGAPVGTCGLFDISHMHGRAFFGIYLGERRDQGLGAEATRLTLQWAFTTLGLRNVLLEVHAWNAAALRAYEKAGFQRIGIRRGATMSRGEQVDTVLMDCTPADLQQA